MSDDRSERLHNRRTSAKEKAQSAADEDQEDAEADEKSGSIKDERFEKMFYLPEEQKKRVDHLYNRLKADYEFAYDEKFEKIRHYYPLVTEYGLAELDGLEAEDIRERLAELDILED